MNKQELREIIRALVKEEVSNQVSKAMGKLTVELIKEVAKGSVTPKHRVVETVEPEPELEEEPIEEPEPRVAIIKTNNPKLASVLAETARNFRPHPKTEDAIAGMDGEFEKIGGGERMTLKNASSKVDFLKQMVAESVQPTSPSITDNAAVPDMLKKVFKKDFRALMKKMDEVKKNGGSGMIPPQLMTE